MRVLVLLVVLFACLDSCQSVLDKTTCKLSAKPAEGSFLALKMNINEYKEKAAKFTIKGTSDKTFELDLTEFAEKEFYIYVDVDTPTENCEIDVDGVEFEEVAISVSEAEVGKKVLVVGQTQNAKLKFKGVAKSPLYTLITSTDPKDGGTSLQVKTKNQNPLDTKVMKSYNNLLHVQADDLDNDKIEVTIVDLGAAESLTLITSVDFELPMDTKYKYVCTEDGCNLPVQHKDYFSYLTVAQRKNQKDFIVNKGDPSKEFKVTPDTSYIKKNSQSSDEFERGEIDVFCTLDSDKIEVTTKNLGFIGQQVSGFWTSTGNEKAFEVKVKDPTDLTISVNNKVANNKNDLQRTVSFNPNEEDFFYITSDESQPKFKFQIKADKESKVEISEMAKLPTEVLLSAGTTTILDSSHIGLIERPGEDKQVYLEIKSPTQSKIKLGSKLIILDKPLFDTLRFGDFGNRKYMQLKVFGNGKITVERFDRNVAAKIVDGDNTLTYSQAIHVPYSQQGYTLEIDNTLRNSDFVTIEFDNKIQKKRTLEKGSTDLVFFHKPDYNLKNYIEGKVSLEQGKELNIKGSEGIKTFKLESKDYYLRDNAAVFKPENVDYDYYLKFRVLDDEEEMSISLLNENYVLNEDKKFDTVKIRKADHQGQAVNVKFVTTNPSKEARILIDIQAAPCSVNSCENKGVCRDGQGSNFNCLCEDEYEGKRCEIKKSKVVDAEDSSSPHVKAAVWVIVGVVSFAFLMN